jgi:hypothetical protein
MIHKNKLLALFLTVALSGCVSFNPDPSNPPQENVHEALWDCIGTQVEAGAEHPILPLPGAIGGAVYGATWQDHAHAVNAARDRCMAALGWRADGD